MEHWNRTYGGEPKGANNDVCDGIQPAEFSFSLVFNHWYFSLKMRTIKWDYAGKYGKVYWQATKRWLYCCTVELQGCVNTVD